MTRSSNNNKTTFFIKGWSRGCLSEFGYTAWVKPGRGYNKHPTLDSVNSKFDLQQLSVKCRKCGKFRIQRKYFFIMCRQRATTTTTNCDEWAGLFIQRSGVGRGSGLTNMNFSYFENSRPALHFVWAAPPSSDLVKVQKKLDFILIARYYFFTHTAQQKVEIFKIGGFHFDDESVRFLHDSNLIQLQQIPLLVLMHFWNLLTWSGILQPDLKQEVELNWSL